RYRKGTIAVKRPVTRFRSAPASDITTIGRARSSDRFRGRTRTACQAGQMRNLVADLRAITGPGHVIVEPDVVAGYATDWTRRYSGIANCVVTPGSTAEVADVVRVCSVQAPLIIPQGGNTGLVGGSVPSASSAGPAAVILSTRRLAGLGPVDRAAAPVTAGAGVPMPSLAAPAAAAGPRHGVDLGRRGPAPPGGPLPPHTAG